MQQSRDKNSQIDFHDYIARCKANDNLIII